MSTTMSTINTFSILLLIATASLATVCPDNEFVPDCNPIEPTCEDPLPHPLKGCPTTGACHCLPNFYRHNGTCVSADECGNFVDGFNAILLDAIDSCKANEKWYACGRQELTCLSIRFRFHPIMMWCLRPGCYCADGLVRDEKLGCISVNDCPKTT
uniref:TIL domain-containing protein n=1 Tax=Panagrellus redivivus TaxID=6233 RepID=A0A7E4VGS0_PANRE